MSKFEFEDILRYSELYKSGYSLIWLLQFIANKQTTPPQILGNLEYSWGNIWTGSES